MWFARMATIEIGFDKIVVDEKSKKIGILGAYFKQLAEQGGY